MSNSLNILLVEPYFTGSHKAWATGLQKYSRHNIELLTMPGNYWKWRMHGGAITLSKKLQKENIQPDLLLAADMLDLTTFLSLLRGQLHGVPTAIYFHENQLTYPWSPTDRDVQNKRDNHYSFINYSSAMAADKVFFNSAFHRSSFLKELERFLKSFPDHNELQTVHQIELKSEVLHLGMDLQKFDAYKQEQSKEQLPLLLWNHRWEYDKNPEQFFELTYALQKEAVDFEVAVLGENFSQQPDVFEQAKKKLGDKVVQFGYANSFEDYATWLYRADLLPVTSNQDFFGGSVVEAIYCNCYPLLPKRLAYPEHIPANVSEQFFYDSFSALVEKTKNAILDINSIRKTETKQYVQQYDWVNMISEYDDAFEKMAKNPKN